MGYQVFETRIGFIHGACIHEAPDTEEHHIKIAWAGALAQLIVAIPLIVLAQFKIFTEVSYLGPVYVFLGYFSFLIALVNLAPARGFDGHVAWRVVPLALNKLRRRTKKKRGPFKIIK